MEISVKRWKQLAGILKENLGDDMFPPEDMEHGRGEEPLDGNEFADPEPGSEPLDPSTFEETTMIGAVGGPSQEGMSAQESVALEMALHGDPEPEEDEFAPAMDAEPSNADLDSMALDYSLVDDDLGFDDDMYEQSRVGGDDDRGGGDSTDWLGGSYVKENPGEPEDEQYPTDHREQDEYDRTEYHDDGELQFEADDSIASLFEGDDLGAEMLENHVGEKAMKVIYFWLDGKLPGDNLPDSLLLKLSDYFVGDIPPDVLQGNGPQTLDEWMEEHIANLINYPPLEEENSLASLFEGGWEDDWDEEGARDREDEKKREKEEEETRVRNMEKDNSELYEWNFDKKDSDDDGDSDDEDAEKVKAMEDEEDGRAESKGNDPKGS